MHASTARATFRAMLRLSLPISTALLLLVGATACGPDQTVVVAYVKDGANVPAGDYDVADVQFSTFQGLVTVDIALDGDDGACRSLKVTFCDGQDPGSQTVGGAAGSACSQADADNPTIAATFSDTCASSSSWILTAPGEFEIDGDEARVSFQGRMVPTENATGSFEVTVDVVGEQRDIEEPVLE